MADGRALRPLPRRVSGNDAPPRRGTAGLVMLAAMILSACFGGGGGGTDPESSVAGKGGSGVVIVRYLAPTVYGPVDENGTLTLTAPANHKFVAVQFASYGTPSGSNGSYVQGGCHAPVSRERVETAFLGLSSSSIAASNGVFGDPCGGTYKSLAVVLAVKPG